MFLKKTYSIIFEKLCLLRGQNVCLLYGLVYICGCKNKTASVYSQKENGVY